MQREKIDSLTSLRFFAAAAVVVFHTENFFGGYGMRQNLALWQAVSFFYVLSGFILSHAHSSMTQGHGTAAFLVSRAARVWPLHLACLLVAYVLIRHDGAIVPAGTTILNALLLQSWSPNTATIFSLNGVSWTLSNEVFFYAFFPVLIRNAPKTWGRNLALLLAATALMMILATVTPEPWKSWSAYISPITRLSEFMMGIAAYQLRRPLMDRLRHSNSLEISALILVATALLIGPRWPTTDRAVTLWLQNCSSGLIFALLILVFSLQRGQLSRALCWRPWVYLGEISFALYMVHQLLIRFVGQHPDYFRWLGNYGLQAAYWGAALLASMLCHHLLEKPFQRVIVRRVLNRCTPIHQAVAFTTPITPPARR